MDGAGRCGSSRHPAADVRTNIAALFVIMFIYGWNQFLWPLLITTDDE
jgi:sn-glycerol 3-phosphate transport system permease protein